MPCGINLEVRQQSITCLTGPSGSGKTLLARSLAGLLPANLYINEGHVYFENRLIPKEELRKLSGRQVFYVPQDASAALNPVIKVKRQIVEAVPESVRSSYLIQILDDLNISSPHSVLDAYPFQLSGGEKQRCLLAMAIVRKPSLIILDEPTSALDSKASEQFIKLIRQMQNQYSATILFITHNLEIVRLLSDYVYVMEAGKIVEEGVFDSIESLV